MRDKTVHTVALATKRHNDTTAYVGNVNIDIKTKGKDQLFPYVVMFMLLWHYVRMFTLQR